MAAPAWYFRFYSYDLHINRDQDTVDYIYPLFEITSKR